VTAPSADFRAPSKPQALAAPFPPSASVSPIPLERDGQSAELVPIGAAVAIASAVTPELVARAQTGDHAAFESIFTAYQGPIYNYVARLIGNPEDAYELTQDTFLKAYLALPKTSDDLKFGAWLYRIATNVCLDELRHRKLVTWVDLGAVFALFASPSREALDHVYRREIRRHGYKLIDQAVDGNPEAAALAGEHAEAVQRTLDRLRPMWRACLILREFHDLDYDGIAEAMGLSRASVKSMLYRARESFARQWRIVTGEGNGVRVRRAY
jgi:RNA polymerase sigma-70 factor, ECF subfamily